MQHPHTHRSLPVLLAACLVARLVAAEAPDPLLAIDGSRITTPAAWTAKRRPELLELITREMYGRIPVERPAGMTCTVTRQEQGAVGGAADAKTVRIAWHGPGGDGGMDLVLFVPRKRSAPAPCMLLICNRSRRNLDPARSHPTGYWPVEEIVARGYATAAFYYGDIAPDKADSFATGGLGVLDPVGKPRPDDAWGALAAWAWGASRAIDYLASDRDIDSRRIAVVGQSRGGKAALWCGARDERVALTISNCSGCSGAAMSRGKSGQDLAGLNREFPHWLDGNYKHWDKREFHAPFDQHEVIALCAPRLVYVASASGDWGSDPKSEFRACVAASPVWGLWKQSGLAQATMPAADTPLQEGSIGYHMRSGEHDLKSYDWQRFMDFADRHLRPR